MNNLLLPKGRLSYSQMIMWQSSPDRYVREYFESGEKVDTKYFRFGKWLAKLIEEDKHHELLPTLVVYPIREHEINTKILGVPVLCFLDQCMPDMSSIRDDKSGKIGKDKKTGKPILPWTLAKCQKSKQLLFYACAIRAEYGIVPKTGYIDWVETLEDISESEGLSNGKEIRVTGNITSFERIFDERELDRFDQEILKVALEISNCYRNWIAEI